VSHAKRQTADAPADPLRAVYHLNGRGGVSRITQPSPTSVARGVLNCPEVMEEMFRLLAWTEPETLEKIRLACEAALTEKEKSLTRYTTLPHSQWRLAERERREAGKQNKEPE